MKTKTNSQPVKTSVEHKDEELLPQIFAGLLGLLLGLSLVKFGNPVVLEKMIDWPTNIYEWIFMAWPVVIAYWLLGGVVVVGLLVARWKIGLPVLLTALPLVWLIWEVLAGTQTVNDRLTRATLIHFTTCVVCFYLGLVSLGRVRRLWLFWAAILGGFILVLLSGFQQHFGGLEETRHYFYLYEPNLQTVSPDLLKKMASNRIFGTLFYPNALAGVILLLLPAILVVLWSMRERLTIGARLFLMALVGASALACLYWSGSKGGWLLLLLIGFVAIMFLPLKGQIKLILIGGVLVLGLAGFFVKYSGFFRHGATSVVARFDYWRAAVQTVKERPLFGTGPGTFAIAYERLKKPESEMARLTHNDYLQQASDSGIIGFLIYTTMIGGFLTYACRKSGLRENRLNLAVWLGVLGWALQCFVEFGLYIPALSWPAFCFMGWLLAQSSKPIDTKPAIG
jgi:O-Antigen ligase